MTDPRAADSDRTPMTAMRKTSLVAGILYLTTFVTSIPVTFWLYSNVLHHSHFVLGAGSDAGVPLGALLEIICAVAGIGTAVVLYPVAKRYNDRAALGFVTTRVLEASMIFVGVLSLLAIYTLRQDTARASAADSGSLVHIGQALLAIHDWTFLVGPGLMAGMNALLLGSIMYRSRLVPRIIPIVGLIGAPLLIASCTATLFGVFDQISPWATVGALPVALWELSLGTWMTFKGFSTDAPTDTPAMVDPTPTYDRVAA